MYTKIVTGRISGNRPRVIGFLFEVIVASFEKYRTETDEEVGGKRSEKGK